MNNLKNNTSIKILVTAGVVVAISSSIIATMAVINTKDKKLAEQSPKITTEQETINADAVKASLPYIKEYDIAKQNLQNLRTQLEKAKNATQKATKIHQVAKEIFTEYDEVYNNLSNELGEPLALAPSAQTLLKYHRDLEKAASNLDNKEIHEAKIQDKLSQAKSKTQTALVNAAIEYNAAKTYIKLNQLADNNRVKMYKSSSDRVVDTLTNSSNSQLKGIAQEMNSVLDSNIYKTLNNDTIPTVAEFHEQTLKEELKKEAPKLGLEDSTPIVEEVTTNKLSIIEERAETVIEEHLARTSTTNNTTQAEVCTTNKSSIIVNPDIKAMKEAKASLKSKEKDIKQQKHPIVQTEKQAKDKKPWYIVIPGL